MIATMTSAQTCRNAVAGGSRRGPRVSGVDRRTSMKASGLQGATVLTWLEDQCLAYFDVPSIAHGRDSEPARVGRADERAHDERCLRADPVVRPKLEARFDRGHCFVCPQRRRGRSCFLSRDASRVSSSCAAGQKSHVKLCAGAPPTQAGQLVRVAPVVIACAANIQLSVCSEARVHACKTARTLASGTRMIYT